MIWNPAAEALGPAERAALQVERLRATLEWATARVAFYRERLAGVEIRRLEDVTRLPFTRKSDLRDHYPFGLLAVPRREIVRVHASSGTRGKPTIVGYTAEDLEMWREVMARVLVAAGARPGDLMHIAFGYGLFTGGLGFHQGAERLGLTVVPASAGHTTRQCLLLRDLQPAGLCATPSFALHLAEALAAEGVKPAELGLRYGIFGAEPWSEAVRRAIETGLGLRAYDVYGLSEIVGPGVSGECEVREGLHVADDHFLPEVVDPATGEPRDPGQPGELVLTTLTKRGLPLIRYRTGDITALEPAPCRCGRTSVRMRRVVGRADDMLVVKGVNVYPSEVEAALLALPELAPHYRLVVDRRAALPRLEVQVEATTAFCRQAGGLEEARPPVAALRARAAGRLQAALGLTVEVQVVPPGTLPRSEGKAVRVVERA